MPRSEDDRGLSASWIRPSLSGSGPRLAYFRDRLSATFRSRRPTTTREVVRGAGAASRRYFYGPILQGMHRTGTASPSARTAFRRAADLSAATASVEDLVTSSGSATGGIVMFPRSLAPGLVPADLDSYLKQRLKWS